jgi:hypothetical protein
MGRADAANQPTGLINVSGASLAIAEPFKRPLLFELDRKQGLTWRAISRAVFQSGSRQG